MRFSGQTVIVTGGAGGIGRAIAERFAGQGSKVVVNDIGPDGRPPPDNVSRCERIVDKSLPVPEPNLNNIASLVARRMMSSMLSSTC